MDITFFKKIINQTKKFENEVNLHFPKKKFIKNIQHFDIVVITASIDEYHSFSKYIEDSENIEYANDSIIYLKGYITIDEACKLSIIMPIPSDMGIATASINTTKCIMNFNPRYLFMVGICAGIKATTKIGDIIFAEKTLDYNEVIEIENSNNTVRTKFMNNIIGINNKLKSKAQLFSKNYNVNEFLNDNFSVNYKLKSHFGLIVTGSSLLRNSEKVGQIIKDFHNVKGIDMETYGVYKSIKSFEEINNLKFFSIKAVSDYADTTKDDKKIITFDKKELALYNSSQMLYNFIKTLT